MVTYGCTDEFGEFAPSNSHFLFSSLMTAVDMSHAFVQQRRTRMESSDTLSTPIAVDQVAEAADAAKAVAEVLRRCALRGEAEQEGNLLRFLKEWGVVCDSNPTAALATRRAHILDWYLTLVVAALVQLFPFPRASQLAKAEERCNEPTTLPVPFLASTVDNPESFAVKLDAAAHHIAGFVGLAERVSCVKSLSEILTALSPCHVIRSVYPLLGPSVLSDPTHADPANPSEPYVVPDFNSIGFGYSASNPTLIPQRRFLTALLSSLIMCDDGVGSLISALLYDDRVADECALEGAGQIALLLSTFPKEAVALPLPCEVVSYRKVSPEEYMQKVGPQMVRLLGIALEPPNVASPESKANLLTRHDRLDLTCMMIMEHFRRRAGTLQWQLYGKYVMSRAFGILKHPEAPHEHTALSCALRCVRCCLSGACKTSFNSTFWVLWDGVASTLWRICCGAVSALETDVDASRSLWRTVLSVSEVSQILGPRKLFLHSFLTAFEEAADTGAPSMPLMPATEAKNVREALSMVFCVVKEAKNNQIVKEVLSLTLQRCRNALQVEGRAVLEPSVSHGTEHNVALLVQLMSEIHPAASVETSSIVVLLDCLSFVVEIASLTKPSLEQLLATPVDVFAQKLESEEVESARRSLQSVITFIQRCSSAVEADLCRSSLEHANMLLAAVVRANSDKHTPETCSRQDSIRSRMSEALRDMETFQSSASRLAVATQTFAASLDDYLGTVPLDKRSKADADLFHRASVTLVGLLMSSDDVHLMCCVERCLAWIVMWRLDEGEAFLATFFIVTSFPSQKSRKAATPEASCAEQLARCLHTQQLRMVDLSRLQVKLLDTVLVISDYDEGRTLASPCPTHAEPNCTQQTSCRFTVQDVLLNLCSVHFSVPLVRIAALHCIGEVSRRVAPRDTGSWSIGAHVDLACDVFRLDSERMCKAAAAKMLAVVVSCAVFPDTISTPTLEKLMRVASAMSSFHGDNVQKVTPTTTEGGNGPCKCEAPSIDLRSRRAWGREPENEEVIQLFGRAILEVLKEHGLSRLRETEQTEQQLPELVVKGPPPACLSIFHGESVRSV